MWQQAYRISDGKLLVGGCFDVRQDPSFDGQTCDVVELPGPPGDGHTHYDANSPSKTRPPSSEEFVVLADERKDRQASIEVDDRAIKAAVICSLWGRLNRQPTGPEIQAERTRFINIYKSLP